MAQQINLFSPLLLSRKQVFTARTMAAALAVFLVLIGLMTWFGVSTLKASGDAARRQLVDRTTEKARLADAIQGKSSADGQSRDHVAREADVLGAELRTRTAILSELKQGLVLEDNGHSARMRLVGQTIPPVAWVTELVVDGGAMTLVGATTGPASLNDWMQRLAAHPLFVDQQFSSVKVEKQSGDAAQRWNFTLASQARAAASAASGGRP